MVVSGPSDSFEEALKSSALNVEHIECGVEYLSLPHLMRFDVYCWLNPPDEQKLERTVPVRIDMSKIVDADKFDAEFKNDNYEYELYGIVIWKSEKHYFVYIKILDTWFKMDAESCHPVPVKKGQSSDSAIAEVIRYSHFTTEKVKTVLYLHSSLALKSREEKCAVLPELKVTQDSTSYHKASTKEKMHTAANVFFLTYDDFKQAAREWR